MKKILLFLFMCLSSFLIYENCSALEVSEVNDSNIYQYFQENYLDYFNDYYFIYSNSSAYILMSFDKIINFSYTPSSGDFRIQPSCLETFTASMVWLNKDLTEKNKKLNYSHAAKTNVSDFYIGGANTNNLETIRQNFIVCNFDVYARYSSTIQDVVLIEKKELVEPTPTPTPDIPALPGDEGGVVAIDVISVYMKYFLMCFPVGLIMVMFEKFIEIIHNFILGKMRK